MQSKLVTFQKKGDERGSLIALENGHNIPFDVKRVYYIFDTKESVRRGYHAHKNLKQMAICVRGSCKFLCDSGHEKKVYELSSPDVGLYLEGLIWREMFDFSADCVIVVLADEYYDESDYIRNYADFLKLVSA